MFPEIPPRVRRHFSDLSFTLGEEITSKLVEARSLLYRNEILQPNTHWKAFFKLYKIITPLHRSDLKIQQNFAEIFQHFFQVYIIITMSFPILVFSRLCTFAHSKLDAILQTITLERQSNIARPEVVSYHARDENYV